MREQQPPTEAARPPTPGVLFVRLRNLLFGGLFGALVMLVMLPASRQFYVGTVVPSGLDEALTTTSALARGSRLPTTRTLDGRAMWFHLAARRILRRRPIGPQEISTVEAMLRAAAIEEPQNAFWLQADAALLAQLGRLDEANAAWMAASHRLNWNDHQTDFLAGVLIGRRSIPAYAYAELCELRTDNGAKLILETGRKLLSTYWADPKLNLPLRLATVMNGNLVRQRSKSIASMFRGTEVIESAVSKPEDTADQNRQHPKGLLIARTAFWKAVAGAKLGYDRDAIERIFDEADAANALTTIQNAPDTMNMEAEEAAILHSTPGAILLCTLLGALILGLNAVLRWIYSLRPQQSWPRTAVAAGIGITLGLFCTSIFVAFALGLCIVFAGLTPNHVRKRRPLELGPLFNLMTSSVTFLLLIAGAGGLILAAVPSRVLLVPNLPPAFNGPAVVFGIVALAIGFLLLCAPLWAYAQRLPTAYVLNIGLSQLGKKLMLGSLLLAVVTGPTCVYLDKLLVEHRLKDQFRSEPNSYLLPNIKPNDAPTP